MNRTKNKRIYLSAPHMTGGEQKFLDEAFEQNWIAPLGPNVDEFEKELANYCGVKHAAVLSSGTAAIHLALIILDVQPGDFVISQSFTFGASAFPIRYMGATPVFVDSEPDTWNMDPGLLEKAIQDCISGSLKPVEIKPSEKCEPAKRDKPKAIIPVHLYGMPYKSDEIHRIAKKYSIPVIEDAAEALGSSCDGKKCGSLGEMGVLSFNGNKIITTSGGGALLSDDEDLINKARFLASQARDPAPHYEHSQIGYNYRMSNILAGIGRGQLQGIDERIRRRREIFDIYRRELSGIYGISFLEEPGNGIEKNSDPEENLNFNSNRWLTTILIDKRSTGFSHEDLRLVLEKEDIESRPLWKPMHLQPIFKRYPAFLNTSKASSGYSGWLFERGLCLPSGSGLDNNEIRKVINTIKSLCAQ